MKIAVLMMELFEQKKVDDVYIVYTKMLNSMTFEPKVQQLLPLNVNNFVTSEEDVTRHHEATFYPTVEAVMEHLTPNFMKGLIYGAMVESSKIFLLYITGQGRLQSHRKLQKSPAVQRLRNKSDHGIERSPKIHGNRKNCTNSRACH